MVWGSALKSGQPQEMSLGPRAGGRSMTPHLVFNLVSEHIQGMQAKESRLGRGAQGEQRRIWGTEIPTPDPFPPTLTHTSHPPTDPNSTSMEFI